MSEIKTAAERLPTKGATAAEVVAFQRDEITDLRAALGKAERERDALKLIKDEAWEAAKGVRQRLEVERDAALAELTALRAQEPVGVVAQDDDGIFVNFHHWPIESLEIGSNVYASAGAAPIAGVGKLQELEELRDEIAALREEMHQMRFRNIARDFGLDKLYAGAVRSIPKGVRRKLLDELGAGWEGADGDEWDDAVVTMVENYLSAGAAPVPDGCTDKDVEVLRDANLGLATENQNLRKALRFYASKWHFTISDESAWDTVSGEPQNFYEDEAGTALVEDGSIAGLALVGKQINWEDEEPPVFEGEPESYAAMLSASPKEPS